MSAAREAVDALRAAAAALERFPDDAAAAQGVLTAARAQNRMAEALALLSALACRNPKSVALHGTLAGAYAEVEQFRESVAHFRRVAELLPGQGPDFYQCYSRALARAGRAAEAVALAEATIRRFPKHVELYIQQANNFMALADPEKTELSYRRGLAADPSHAVLLHSIGLMRFLRTGMQEGFDLYRHRFRLPGTAMPRFPVPEWDGRAEGRLLLWAEQGLGDIVMFAGLIPSLFERNLNITFAVPPKAAALFARSFPDFEAIPLAPEIPARAAERYNFHLPLGELMRLALSQEDLVSASRPYIPAAHPPYLKADAERTAALRQKYRTFAAERGAEKIVGFSWHTVNPHTGFLRNIPLPEWGRLFAEKRVLWVSLQYDGRKAELAAAAHGRENVLYDSEIDGYRDTDALAAQIAAMDQVITIQNATAHLAGALGVPTTLLLSAASDWRWGLGEENLWYASVRILRQKTNGDWGKVMKEIRKHLPAIGMSNLSGNKS